MPAVSKRYAARVSVGLALVWLVLVLACLVGGYGLKKRLLAEQLAVSDVQLLNTARVFGSMVRAGLDTRRDVLLSIESAADYEIEAAARLAYALTYNSAHSPVHPSSPELAGHSERGLAENPAEHRFFVVDLRGRIVDSGDTTLYSDSGVAERGNLLQLAQPGSPPDIVTEFIDTRTNRPTFALARRMEKPDTPATGILVAVIDTNFLLRQLEARAVFADDCFLLARQDGFIYFHHGPGPDVSATFSTALARELKAVPQQVFESASAIDGIVRRGCTVDLGYGMFLYMGRTPHDMEYPVSAAAADVVVYSRLLALGLTLFACLLLYVMRRNARALRQQGEPAQANASRLLPAAAFIACIENSEPGALILLNSNGLERMKALLGEAGVERMQDEVGDLILEYSGVSGIAGRLGDTVFGLFQAGAGPDSAAYTAQLVHDRIASHLMQRGNSADVCVGVACFSRRVSSREMLHAAQSLLKEARTMDGDFIIQRSF